jgi:Tol biopolymer transport system component/imidazolonepropionase-like amidohydrolase
MFLKSKPFLLSSILIAVLTVPTIGSPPIVGPNETISIRVSEGTNLAFDISPDGRTIVFDLLGQLWLLPAKGGKARPLTDAVKDSAEDVDPSFSPDGKSVLFRGERNGRTGLWLLTLSTGAIRQLTQLANPSGFDGNAAWSPDGKAIVFQHAVPPPGPGTRWRMAIDLYDVGSGQVSEVAISGTTSPRFQGPVWTRDGKQIAFIVRPPGESGGSVWTVSPAGGQASPLADPSAKALSPILSDDGHRLAYFAPDKDGRLQVWAEELGRQPVVLTNQSDVTPTRLRWAENGTELLYTANGRLWAIPVSGGQPREIRFTAELSITRQKRELPQARFPEPGKESPARGFMGLSISPDGQRIGMLALGKLWVIPVSGTPKAVADVPFEAASLAWSPDGREIAWSAGVADHEDLFATDIATGATRRVTSLTGRESYPVYSPDGRYIAFVHIEKENGTLRLVDSRSKDVADIASTTGLGSIGSNWTCTPQWSPESDGLLVCGGADPAHLGRATFVKLSGERESIDRFPNAPIFLNWTQQHQIIFVRHDRLWQMPFEASRKPSEPKTLGEDAALYASASANGSILFVSEGGLKLRSADGTTKKIGWPVSFASPVAEETLIRNVRIIDGTGASISDPSDILIQQGRIARIEPTGRIQLGAARILDAGGRIVIPGLMDLHAHTYRPDLLPGFPYFGITTIRDQGSSMGPLSSYASDIAAGVLPGPRVSYGGFQFYSDWAFDEEQGRGIEPEADPDHIKRAVDLAVAFGAQHIKTRTFRRWDINARMISEAHRRGLRATGHCSHLLPLIAAGMDAKEHIGSCEARGDTHMFEDMIQLFRAAGIGVVPTITYFSLAVNLNERPALLDDDKELLPFMLGRENFGWMIELTASERKQWVELDRSAREETAKLFRAGVTVGTGTDIWQLPVGVHWELEQMVKAGIPPLQAIQAATGNSAKILGAEKDLGTIKVGKWADIVILDGDPLADIRNTRRIWNVLQYGRILDRPAILKIIKPR